MPSSSAAAQMERQAAEVLSALVGEAVLEAKATRPQRDDGVDLLVTAGKSILAVQVKQSSDATAIRGALDQLERYRARHPKAVPLLATQFMGPIGRELCAERKVGWFDLSGNADISAHGLRILVDGKPNQFKRPGRPSTAFAPKSSRIARWLLMYGDTGWTQQELTEHTGLDKGYASRVLKRLRGQALVRVRGERYYADHRDLLLQAWQAQYDFSKHHIIKGVMPARSGEEATRAIAAVLKPDEYAATGLSGAWFLDHFANFRTASVYLKEAPSEQLLDRLSFRKVEQGANVWLIVPSDEGVFLGMGASDGVTCAHWVQVYLDLAFHPERSKEAAEHLRQTQQNWSARGE